MIKIYLISTKEIGEGEQRVDGKNRKHTATWQIYTQPY